MPKRGSFEEAVNEIVQRDPRFHKDAYAFLRDALDYTMKNAQEDEKKEGSHVSGEELLQGFREYAIEEFGPMVPAVFDQWGIGRCEDVGEMVFNLIEVEVFGKSSTDQIEDFSAIYDFREAFVVPFLPSGRRGVTPLRGAESGRFEQESPKQS